MDDFMTKLRSELEALQNQLQEKTVEATDSDGLVKIIVNGHQEVAAIVLDPRTLYPKNQIPLQSALKQATNEAIRLSRELLRQELADLTGGFDFSRFPELY
jgi:DNA-binding YbaB/EbfC family protein